MTAGLLFKALEEVKAQGAVDSHQDICTPAAVLPHFISFNVLRNSPEGPACGIQGISWQKWNKTL